MWNEPRFDIGYFITFCGDLKEVTGPHSSIWFHSAVILVASVSHLSQLFQRTCSQVYSLELLSSHTWETSSPAPHIRSYACCFFYFVYSKVLLFLQISLPTSSLWQSNSFIVSSVSSPLRGSFTFPLRLDSIFHLPSSGFVLLYCSKAFLHSAYIF